jgi:hypothetical protein
MLSRVRTRCDPRTDCVLSSNMASSARSTTLATGEIVGNSLGVEGRRMDRDAFDRVTKLLAVHPSRRVALGALLGVALRGYPVSDVEAKRNKRHKRKRKGKRKNCFPGTSCVLGAGQAASGCNFSHSTQFAGLDLRGADLSHSGFLNADLRGTDLRDADLSGACFLEANLLDAKLDGANISEAIFCLTLMPDGSVDSSGCDRATGCCSAKCQGGACAGWDGCTPVENACVPLGRPCCPNTDCTKVIPSKFDLVGTCQSRSCTTTDQCASRFPGQDVICQTDGTKCSGYLLSSCCTPKPCSSGTDCPHSGRCCNERCCSPGQICTFTGCFGKA